MQCPTSAVHRRRDTQKFKLTAPDGTCLQCNASSDKSTNHHFRWLHRCAHHSNLMTPAADHVQVDTGSDAFLYVSQPLVVLMLIDLPCSYGMWTQSTKSLCHSLVERRTSKVKGRKTWNIRKEHHSQLSPREFTRRPNYYYLLVWD